MALIRSMIRVLGRHVLKESMAGLAGGMIARADAARDAKRYRDAGVLYSEALLIDPGNAGIHIQCGHMFKEAGDLAAAEGHYGEAVRLTPDDADLALQMGHFFKVAGRLKEAEASYQRATELKPDWADPAFELAQLRRTMNTDLLDRLEGAGGDVVDDGIEHIAPELAPRRSADLRSPHRAAVQIRRLGLQERSFWGVIRTLRGVEAIRGFCIAGVPIVEVRIVLGGSVVHCGAPSPGAVIEGEAPASPLRKYVFNVWHDFSDVAHGHDVMEFRFVGVDGSARLHREGVVVAAPRSEADHPDSDGLVRVDPRDARTVEEQVNARPSMIRPATRSLFPRAPRAILVLRADQLGDMVCSIPAIRRLRELFPDARLVGLLSPANHELAATLDLFDDIVVADFPDDPAARRRIMPIVKQKELRGVLHRFAFDLAIDLSDSGVSRPLLVLSGAPFLFGFRQGEFAWLTAGFEGVTRDVANGLERVPHTNKVLGLIEWLDVQRKSHARIEPRHGLDRSLLEPFGLAADDRYVVLHTGARLAFSRWPHFAALAAMLLARTDVRVVMMTDDPAERSLVPGELLASERFTLIDERPSFDAFDALLSFCAAFVGNDSGPKHLASLRGANVVSLHMARNNWNEWGQENKGVVISRKLPCAGCSIHHEPEECGKGFVCITNIMVDEVFGAVLPMLDGVVRPEAAALTA